jgi:nitrogen regulatory protein PII
MREIFIYIPTHDHEQVSEILRKHTVGGISFYEINGAGRTQQDTVPKMVRSYMTGRMIIPDYAKRTKVEVLYLIQ